MSRNLVVALAAGLLLTAGCGGDATRTASPADPTSASPSASGDQASAPASPRAAASRRVVASQPPAPDPSVSLRQTGPGRGPWLAASDLGRQWSEGRRGPEDGRLVSECQRAPLVDIGALRSRIREFSRTDGSARQAVSTFADGRSAWRAQRVLDAWREDCADALAGRRAALGAVRHRSRLSVVEVDGSRRAERRLERLLATVSARLQQA